MDTMTKEQRHRCMSLIHSRDTKPEMLVRKYLFGQGFRYRLNSPRLPGHPDLVLRKYRTVIFINGCFWHGHEGCRYHTIPKTNTEFWIAKISRNRERDRAELKALTELGWRCITVWECGLRPKFRGQTLGELSSTLRNLLFDPRVRCLEIAPSTNIVAISAGDNLPGVRPYGIPDAPVTRAAEPEAAYRADDPEL